MAVAVYAAWPMIRYCEPGQPASTCRWAYNMGTATDDGRYFGMVWEAARVALQDFHQLPSWNPYHCGGVVLYQDPQAPFPGPLFLLTFWWLPAIVALKLWEIVHLAVAALGMRRLTADMGANLPEQALAAALVTAGGSIMWHLGGGNLSFSAFLLFPWVLWSHRKALTAPRYAVLTGALLALSAVEGGVYPLPLMLSALAIDTVARLGDRDERRALFVSLPVTGLFAGLLSAVRMVPVLHYLKDHPRLMPLDDQMTVAEVFSTWTTREHDWQFPSHPFVWDEYGDYLGVVPVALMLLGALVAVWRRDELSRARRIDLALLIGIVWLALGNIPGFSLYGLMHELPIYRSLRVPSRYLFAGNLAFAMVCTWALVAARDALRSVRARRAVMALFVLVECGGAAYCAREMTHYNHSHVQRGVDEPMVRARASADFHQDSSTDYAKIPTHAMRGVGTSQCYVPMEWEPSPSLWNGPASQVRVIPPEAGTAEQTRWTPNEVAVRVQVRGPARLVVNQNYEVGWRASTGTTEPFERLLSVNLPAGEHTVVFRHRPPGVVIGFALTVLGALLSLFAWMRLTPESLERLRERAAKLFTAPKE